jgi:SM-20-related protein
MIPDRYTQIDGAKICVFDNLIVAEEVRQYVDALDGAAFKRTEIARSDTNEVRHFASEMPLKSLAHVPILKLTEAALAEFAAQRYRPYRAYTNLSTYGDMLFTHTDCAEDSDDITALWYLCSRWDKEWGGETVFFDKSGDALFAVTPRPGRLVLFDGRVTHAGRPPNRCCYASRYTFAIKFERY